MFVAVDRWLCAGRSESDQRLRGGIRVGGGEDDSDEGDVGGEIEEVEGEGIETVDEKNGGVKGSLFCMVSLQCLTEYEYEDAELLR